MKQLDSQQLDAFASQVLTLRARRLAPALETAAEAELLKRINEGLPAEQQHRYDALIAKRQDETLSDLEYKELLRLGEQVERREAERLEALAILAQLRRTSLRDLLQQLGLNGKVHG